MKCAGCGGRISKEQQKIAKRLGAKRLFCKKCTRKKRFVSAVKKVNRKYNSTLKKLADT